MAMELYDENEVWFGIEEAGIEWEDDDNEDDRIKDQRGRGSKRLYKYPRHK